MTHYIMITCVTIKYKRFKV